EGRADRGVAHGRQEDPVGAIGEALTLLAGAQHAVDVVGRAAERAETLLVGPSLRLDLRDQPLLRQGRDEGVGLGLSLALTVEAEDIATRLDLVPGVLGV